jgi:hypothetical protein
MLIKSDIIAQGSGSLAGITMSHNRYGLYLRNRSIPVNPNSDRQASARNRFSQAAERWSSTLTQAQRDAWNLYGNSVTVKNALGDSVFLTGFSHYLRSNSQQQQCLSTFVDDGPTDFTLPETDATATPTVSEATQNISTAFDTNLPWVSEDGAFLQVEMSQPRGVGREFIGGPFRYADCVEGDATTPPTSPQTVSVPFAVTQNQKVEIRYRIGRADGRLSEPFSRTVSVTA